MQSFLKYIYHNGFITRSELNHLLESGDTSSEETTRQQITAAGLMTECELSEALFFYKLNDLTHEQFSCDIFNEYLHITEKGFGEFLQLPISCSPMSQQTTLQENLTIYQTLISITENTFVSGFSGTHGVMMEAASAMHNHLAALYGLPDFEKNHEDMVDFYAELVNNINGACSPVFNVNFDLQLPICREKAVMTAPRIWTSNVSVAGFELTVFIICGGYCSFTNTEEIPSF